MRSPGQVVAMIRKLGIRGTKFTHTEVVNALIWVLGYDESDEIWLKWQEDFHKSHPGAIKSDHRLPTFLKWMGKNKKVLDCGVHSGVHSNEFAKYNDVIGVDLPAVVKSFKKNYKFPCYACNVEYNMDIFSNDSFDVAVAGELIEHLTAPKKFIEEVYRMLRPNGELIISCPYKESELQDPCHYSVIDDEYVKEILGDLFYVEERIIKKGSILILARSSKKKKIPEKRMGEECFIQMRNLVGDRKFESILDVGCGDGHLTSKFSDCANRILALDKNVNKIIQAREKYKHFENIKYDVANFENTGLTGEAGLVLFADVIYYLTGITQRRIVNNIHKILIKDGLLITSIHRPVGEGDDEFDNYKHLFKRLKTEKVFYTKEKFWRISLWKKI